MNEQVIHVLRCALVVFASFLCLSCTEGGRASQEKPAAGNSQPPPRAPSLKADFNREVSCANHVIQHRAYIVNYLHTRAGGHLPHYDNVYDNLEAMGGDSYGPKWLHSIGAACPEAYMADGSIGYLFVGQGLPCSELLKEHTEPLKKQALVMFCPAMSHRGQGKHSMAIVGEQLVTCSYAELTELIDTALEQAREGEVLYSTDACETLREQSRMRHSIMNSVPTDGGGTEAGPGSR